jgi:hypothetical protein
MTVEPYFQKIPSVEPYFQKNVLTKMCLAYFFLKTRFPRDFGTTK